MSVAPDIISKEILRCLTLAEGGLHAVILVISAKTQLSQEEKMIFRTLEVLFGRKLFDYVIIVFSGGDVFEDDDVTLKEYLDDSPDFIKVDISITFINFLEIEFSIGIISVNSICPIVSA